VTGGEVEEEDAANPDGRSVEEEQWEAMRKLSEDVFREEPFRISARCYKAMMQELTSGEDKLSSVSATEITCAHIQALGMMSDPKED
jgi:hypothetical protein